MREHGGTCCSHGIDIKSIQSLDNFGWGNPTTMNDELARGIIGLPGWAFERHQQACNGLGAGSIKFGTLEGCSAVMQDRIDQIARSSDITLGASRMNTEQATVMIGGDGGAD